jgi:AhpD family alkylhydroperoxidase
MFKTLPDQTLELEWGLFKQVQMNDDVIPAKYRELIGVAAGAALGDEYCVVAHRELAKAFGASAEELEVALGLAKGVAGWRTYLTGSGIGLETLRSEIGQVCDFIRSSGAIGGERQAPQGVSTH